jgi:hypothetical protein
MLGSTAAYAAVAVHNCDSDHNRAAPIAALRGEEEGSAQFRFGPALCWQGGSKIDCIPIQPARTSVRLQAAVVNPVGLTQGPSQSLDWGSTPTCSRALEA